MTDDQFQSIMRDIRETKRELKRMEKPKKRKKPVVSVPTQEQLDLGLNVIYVDFLLKQVIRIGF